MNAKQARGAGRGRRLGAEVRALRRARGLRRAALGGRELSADYIRAVERGTVVPSAPVRALLAERLGVPAAALHARPAPPPAAPDLAALDEDVAYQLDHVKAALVSGDGAAGLAALTALGTTCGAVLDALSPATRYRYHRLLAAAYIRVDQPGAGRDPAERALALAAELDDPQEVARAHNVLGAVLYQLGQPGLAFLQHQRALRALPAGPAGDARLRVQVLSNLANDYFALHAPRAAIDHYEEARRLLDDVNDRDRQAGILWGLCYCYRTTGDLDRAKLYAAQAVAALEAGPPGPGLIGMTINLAMILTDRGELPAARAALDRAERLLAAQPDPVLAVFWGEESVRWYLAAGDLAAAAAAAARAVQAGAAAAEEAAAAGPAARTQAWRAYARVLLQAGRVAERGADPAAADAHFAAALDATAHADDRETVAEIRLAYADLLAARGDYEPAAQQYRAVARDAVPFAEPAPAGVAG